MKTINDNQTIEDISTEKLKEVLRWRQGQIDAAQLLISFETGTIFTAATPKSYDELSQKGGVKDSVGNWVKYPCVILLGKTNDFTSKEILDSATQLSRGLVQWSRDGTSSPWDSYRYYQAFVRVSFDEGEEVALTNAFNAIRKFCPKIKLKHTKIIERVFE